MTNETTFNPFSLVVGIFSVIASLIVIRDPLSTIKLIALLVGTISILEGITKILEIRKVDQIATIHKSAWYFSIVLDLLFGVIVLVVPGTAAVFLWITISFTVILNSIIEFWINQFTDVDHGGYYWLNLIFSSLGLAMGIILLFAPSFALSTSLFFLSFAFMFFGVTKIVRSF